MIPAARALVASILRGVHSDRLAMGLRLLLCRDRKDEKTSRNQDSVAFPPYMIYEMEWQPTPTTGVLRIV